MLKILFFGQIRELVCESCLELPAEYPTVEAVRLALMARGERWQLALDNTRVLAAVNQTLVPLSEPLTSGDEVAFFPPVTGG